MEWEVLKRLVKETTGATSCFSECKKTTNFKNEFSTQSAGLECFWFAQISGSLRFVVLLNILFVIALFMLVVDQESGTNISTKSLSQELSLPLLQFSCYHILFLLNFFSFWKWTWCHCILYITQDWNVGTDVMLQENTCMSSPPLLVCISVSVLLLDTLQVPNWTYAKGT